MCSRKDSPILAMYFLKMVCAGVRSSVRMMSLSITISMRPSEGGEAAGCRMRSLQCRNGGGGRNEERRRKTSRDESEGRIRKQDAKFDLRPMSAERQVGAALFFARGYEPGHWIATAR